LTTPLVTPLAGITVLDLTRVLSGPFATMTLGDLGADVIKIERIDGGDDTRHIPPYVGGESHYFLSVNRNKRSVAVDLKSARGQELVRNLARRADVVVENFRPGVAAAMGLDYARLSGENDQLIYCSISGFGQSGPMAQLPAFDIVVQALSGALSVNGHPDGEPVKLGLPIGDAAAGVYAAIGVLAALTARDRTHRGAWIDVSMLDSIFGLFGHLAGQYLVAGTSPTPVGSGHQNIAPYGVYQAADGQIVIATLTPIFWPRLCRALGLEDYQNDARFATNDLRLDHRKELTRLIQARLSEAGVDEWSARFTAEAVPHAPIKTVGQALESAYAEGRSVVRTITHPAVGEVRIPGPVIHFDGHQTPVSHPPVFGEHTAEVLRELGGLSEASIEELFTDRIVAGERPERQEIPLPPQADATADGEIALIDMEQA
jgi:crotonobetainyl-CoA:carnitine CoA-transferase CaiB-like acyl-CoA transferase